MVEIKSRRIESLEPDNYEPKSILITGGAGFVGSNIFKYLWEKFPKAQFHILDILTYAGDLKNISDEIHRSPRFHFWYGDVKNSRLVDSLVERCDVIIHFAAETHVARSIYDDFKFFETDVLGTLTIANAVSRHKDTVHKFIHISTSEVYGTARTEQMAEDHPLEPQSPYAAAKAGADRLVYSYYVTHKIPMVIVRPFNLYGPHQHLEKLIPRFITSALLNEPMTIHGTGHSKRDFTYVTDLAEAIYLIIQAPQDLVVGQIFNVGNERATSIIEIAELVKKYLPQAAILEPNFTVYALNIGDRPGQVFHHISNASKIKEVLGWEAKVSLEEGMVKTIEWYINNKEWWAPKIWMRHVPILTSEGKIELH